ncbi:MAG TPA: D-alanyl-D-alanine carboxypeptidase, partial [Candidatus Obscuribacterales bacterium]
MSRRHTSLILSAVFTWVALLPAPAAESPVTEPAAEKQRVERLDALVRDWLRRPELKNSMVGLEIMDLPSGRTLFNYNANKRFVPASVAKIFTTACALDTLGADFRYQTRLLAYGPARKDRVAGDLVLEPSQDPSLALEDLRRMFLTLNKNGIRHIDGNLHLMRVEGGYDYFSPAWLVEDWGQNWMPVSSNLVLDSNLATLRDAGKGLPVLVEPFEHLDNAMWKSLLLSGVTSGWVSFDSRINRARLFRSPLPELGANATIMVGNPEEYNLAVARLAARASGLKTGAKPARYAPREEALVLAQHSSKPLKDLIELTLRESDNLYAQQLLRTLGLKVRQTRQNVSLEESGLEFLRRWLFKLGVPPG